MTAIETTRDEACEEGADMQRYIYGTNFPRHLTRSNQHVLQIIH